MGSAVHYWVDILGCACMRVSFVPIGLNLCLPSCVSCWAYCSLVCIYCMPWFSCVSFFQVCVLCEDGFIRLHLLSVCCWRSHVMSIMGSPSCLEPELLASVSSFIARYFIWCSLHLLVHHFVFPTCCSLCSLECLLFWDLACLVHGGSL